MSGVNNGAVTGEATAMPSYYECDPRYCGLEEIAGVLPLVVKGPSRSSVNPRRCRRDAPHVTVHPGPRLCCCWGAEPVVALHQNFVIGQPEPGLIHE